MTRTALIVDDSRLIRRAIRGILERAGFEIGAEVGTGAEALAVYRILKPDLVTLDLAMPDSTELEWLQRLIAFDSHARVLVITSMNETHMKEKALSHGAIGFLNKPFDEQALRLFLDEFFG